MSLSNLSNKFLNRMFRKIDGLVWDLSTGQTGIKKPDGVFTLNEVTPASPAVAATETSAAVAAVEAAYQVNINPFESFSIPLPAFALQKPLEQVNPGDLIIGESGPLGWVTKVNGASLKLMDAAGLNKVYTPQKTAILGGEGVLVVQNLLNLTGGAEGLGGLQSSLLPLLALSEGGLGGGDGALDKILPLLLFSQTQGAPGATSGIAAMLPMLLLSGGLGGKSGGSKLDSLLPLLLMGGLGGGAAGAGAQGGLASMLPLLLLSGGDGGGLFGNDSAPTRLPPPSYPPALRQTR